MHVERLLLAVVFQTQIVSSLEATTRHPPSGHQWGVGELMVNPAKWQEQNQ